MTTQKTALITGITGQDGSYLTEFLLSKGYIVHGLIRRASTFNTGRIDHIYVDAHEPGAQLFLHYGDLSDSEQLSNIISNLKPDEVYHLGAQSHVRMSFDMPEYTGNVTGLGTTRILEAIRRSGRPIRFYQASSSEMFGGVNLPQNEQTCFVPRSPYACAKLYAYWMVNNYREGYRLFATNGILFNHESPRRGETFVTRKITRGLSAILAKKTQYLYLGNLKAKRDWGFAPEYVEAMWMMLQTEKPDNFVIGTGETHSIEEFLEFACSYLDIDMSKHIKFDQKYFRPTEVDELKADARKSAAVLGWKPKIKFRDLAMIMLDADLRATGVTPPGKGDALIAKQFPHKWWKGD